MSIYATILTIEHPDEWDARLKTHGINPGRIGDFSEEEKIGSPFVYQGSHVLPAADDPRGGSVSIAMVPSFITRDGRDDGKDGIPKDWLRLDVMEHPDTYGVPQEGYATVVLNREQVQELRDALTNWLEREEE